MITLARGSDVQALRAVGCRTFLVYAPMREIQAMVLTLLRFPSGTWENRDQVYARALALVAWSYPLNRWSTTLWLSSALILGTWLLYRL